MVTFKILQTWIDHNTTCYHNFNALPLRYRTFYLSLTWTGHNATCYHNFNVLPHAIPYIFTQFSTVWGYFQHATTRYRQIYKKVY